jgi:3-oxoacyl-[acyl-carrier-protein] synthase-3
MIARATGSAVKAVMTFHPSRTEDNFELPFHGTTAEQVVRHTGIRYRKIAHPTWRFEDYAFESATQFITAQQLDKDQIDVLVCVTQSAGLSIPSLSFFLHEKLGLSESLCCLDVNLGCSGYVQGIHLVQSLLASIDKAESNGLLICGDFSSQLIDPEDQSVRPIFSDALSVTHIKSSAEYKDKLSAYAIDSDGRGRQAIYLNEAKEGKLRLNGIDVFNYSMRMVPSNLVRLSESLPENAAKPIAVIFHQANKIINDGLSRKMGYGNGFVPSTLQNYGNTASASIPLTICSYFSGTEIIQQNLLLCGFGIGFSVASGLVFFDTSIVHPPKCLDL